MTSNIGHLLWSGIVGDDEAAATGDRLLDEPLYSGWGVRTLGSAEGGYNPLGYHTGTVWPHDNSLIVAGLARYGHHASRPQAWAAGAPLMLLTTLLDLQPAEPTPRQRSPARSDTWHCAAAR
jgi:glycogen debranching enzyme